MDHLGVCQLQRSREAVSPSVAENGIVGLAASVHLSVCLAEPVDEVVGGGGHCPVRFHCEGRKVGVGWASFATFRECGSQVVVEVTLLLVMGVVGGLTETRSLSGSASGVDGGDVAGGKKKKLY